MNPYRLIADLKRSEKAIFFVCLFAWAFDACDFFLVLLLVQQIVATFAGDRFFLGTNMAISSLIKRLPIPINQPLAQQAGGDHALPVFAVVTLTLAFRPLGALIFGRLADRYDRRPILALNVGFFALAEILTALSPHVGFGAFVLFRVLFGIGMGGEWGVGMALAMEWLPAGQRGPFSGLLQQGYPLGYLFAGVIYLLFSSRGGWYALFIAGLLPAMLALFIWKGLERTAPPETSHATSVQPSQDVPDEKAPGRPRWSSAHPFLFIVLLMTAFNAMAHGSQDVYPTFLSTQVGLEHISNGDLVKGAIVLTAVVGALLGGFFFGEHSEREGRLRLIRLAALFALLLIPLWAGLFPPLARAPGQSVVLLAVGAFLMQFMVQGAYGIIPAYLTELAPANARSTFPGAAYQLGNLVSALTPTAIAAFADRLGGPNYALGQALVLAMALILVIGVAALGPEISPVQRRMALAPSQGDPAMATLPSRGGL
jgi:SHS family lactate transporter-like MFS transporter